MKSLPLSQGLSATIDDEDYQEVSKFKWYAAQRRGTWYAARNFRDGIEYMHRRILGSPSGVHTDHKNGDGLDNRRFNLRQCNHQQNQANRTRSKGSTSKFKGVRWKHDRHKWQARIVVKGREIHLGYFGSEEDAARAYDSSAAQAFGEFSHPNFSEAGKATRSASERLDNTGFRIAEPESAEERLPYKDTQLPEEARCQIEPSPHQSSTLLPTWR